MSIVKMVLMVLTLIYGIICTDYVKSVERKKRSYGTKDTFNLNIPSASTFGGRYLIYTYYLTSSYNNKVYNSFYNSYYQTIN